MKKKKSWLVNWYFELSQPQRITSRLKTMFSLSPIYSARKSSNHKVFKNHKISPAHKFTLKKKIQKIHKHRTNIFRRIRPFGTTPVKKAHKARTRWYRGPFRRFINTRFTKDYITAKNNLQSVSYLLCTQVIKPQSIQKPQNQSCTQIYIKQNIHKHQTKFSKN